MKKKILLLVLLLGVLFITGCDKKENMNTISIKDDKLGYETIFKFPKSSDFVLNSESDSGRFKEIVVKNVSENMLFDMYYSQETIETYNKVKESRSKEKNYKEYTFNKYEAYTYGKYDDGVYLVIKLTEEDGIATDLFVSIENITYDASGVVFDKFDRKELLEFFNNMELKITKTDKTEK